MLFLLFVIFYLFNLYLLHFNLLLTINIFYYCNPYIPTMLRTKFLNVFITLPAKTTKHTVSVNLITKGQTDVLHLEH